MFMNWTTRLSARATPGTPRTRSTVVSGKLCAKSTLGVSFDVTQMSALARSIVTVALSSRPLKRPTWTRTRVTAKATPATVRKNRSRSWRRFLRASETMDGVLQHVRDQVGHRGNVGPVLGLQRDEQSHHTVEARPQDLGHRIGVAGAEGAAVDGLHDRRVQQLEGLLDGAAQLVDVLELPGHHEHEPEVVRVLDAEASV